MSKQKYVTIQLPKETMLEILDGDQDGLIEDVLEDSGRWDLQYRMVFEYEGKTYQTFYSRGATEYQDHGPWEGEKMVECYLVTPVQKTITAYECVTQEEVA